MEGGAGTNEAYILLFGDLINVFISKILKQVILVFCSSMLLNNVVRCRIFFVCVFLGIESYCQEFVFRAFDLHPL